ncbi:MAG: hypothetical protein M3014_13380 [Chloroflexota bacterium]|nr:hypothetical protein [Chloroflexota bacterium]
MSTFAYGTIGMLITGIFGYKALTAMRAAAARITDRYLISRRPGAC